MSITYNSENISFPDIDRNTVTAWIKQVAAKYGKSAVKSAIFSVMMSVFWR